MLDEMVALTHCSGWHVVTPQTSDLEALKSKTSAYRRAWCTTWGISAIYDQPGKRASVRLASEVQRGFLRDSNLDPILSSELGNPAYVIESRNPGNSISANQLSFLLFFFLSAFFIHEVSKSCLFMTKNRSTRN